MPFKSDKQRKFLFAKKPEVAKEFASETSKGMLPKDASLPPSPLARSMAGRGLLKRN